MKALSIVVASINTKHTIQLCLATLVEQAREDDLEIVVVDASTDGSAEIARGFSQIKVIQAEPGSLYPELWKMGIDLTNGQAVAFTTANFVPAGNWVSEIYDVLKGDYAAIGGVFEKLEPDRFSQWAIYFLRYSAYLPSTSPRASAQLAADNAVYRRWVFEKYAEHIKDGFWEHPVNRQLAADGELLYLTPDLKVSMGYFSSPGDFFGQRFSHGRVFGAERTARASRSRRLVYVITSPLIPFVLLVRVTRNVLKSPIKRNKFILSLPWLIFFILGWACGELVGYLSANPAERRTPASESSNS